LHLQTWTLCSLNFQLEPAFERSEETIRIG
jgi:hypothetical protein